MTAKSPKTGSASLPRTTAKIPCPGPVARVRIGSVTLKPAEICRRMREAIETALIRDGRVERSAFEMLGLKPDEIDLHAREALRQVLSRRPALIECVEALT